MVQPGDVEALTERMLRLVRDSALRKKLGQAIFEKVKREFSIDATVRTQVEIYETILRRLRQEAGKKHGVLICGAYGNGNVGDETILEAILQQLRDHDGDVPVCVMSKTPRRTARQVQAASVYTFRLFQVRRQLKQAKLFIGGGGSLIQNATSNRSLWFYLYCIWAAHRAGCQVMMYGCGIGPVKRGLNRKLAAKALNACVDLIALRDPDSKTELEKLGVTRPECHVTADPALLQTVTAAAEEHYARYRKEAGLTEGGTYCLFALRPWGPVKHRLEAFAAAAEYGWNTYGMTPGLFPAGAGQRPGDHSGSGRADFLPQAAFAACG